MRKPEYLKFVEADSSWRKTRIVEVCTVSSNVCLGVIQWHSTWRQYCFWPEAQTLYNTDCLSEISKEVFKMNADHREKLQMERVGGT